jgi:NADH dehydrogenase
VALGQIMDPKAEFSRVAGPAKPAEAEREPVAAAPKGS